MFLTRRFYIALVLVILLLGSGYVFAPFFVIGQWALFVLLLVVLADVYSLYRIRGIRAFRQCADRFSNGDENEVSIRVESSYPHPVSLEIIDEIPFIFQKRDVDFQVKPWSKRGKNSYLSSSTYSSWRLLFRSYQSFCDRKNRLYILALYLCRTFGYQSVSVISDAPSI